MTSLSTIVGVLPLILGSGPGEASRLTIGVVIFMGMIFTTFFYFVYYSKHVFSDWKKYR